MRIVFLTHNYPRFSGDVAGNFLHPLAVALLKRNHAVTVVAPSDAGKAGLQELDGVVIHRVRYARPDWERFAYTGAMMDALRSPRGIQALWNLHRGLRAAAQTLARAGTDPCVVHAHWWVPGGLAAPPGVPLVLTLHGTDAKLLHGRLLARWVAAPVLRRAQVLTTVSRTAAEWVRSATGRTIPADCVQPMPVDTSRFRWSSGGSGVILVSRLIPQKRVDLAIRALIEAHRRGKALRLTIVGDGPERGSLEALVNANGLQSSIVFLGSVAPDRIPDLLNQADLMLFPAVGEGFGLVAAEALMSGVPVVMCRDGGGVLDLADGTAACRVTDPSAHAVAGELLALSNDSKATEAAKLLGSGLRVRLAPDAVAARCESWYERALNH